jgi:hypothetical protein
MRNSKILISLIFFLITSISFIFWGCKKNQLGGSSVISGKVRHHSKSIAGASVFIKFNARDFPGDDTTIYDAKVQCDEYGNFVIDDFYKGEYYLFSVGKDNAIPYPYLVKGGISFSIRKNEQLTRDIAVTEGD